MVFHKESEFEEALVTLLFNEKGWSGEILRYKTEKDLLRNWAEILYKNNSGVDRLNGQPLTDGEMQQIMEQIKGLRNPVRLNGFINGGSVLITRDNPADTLHFNKTISLEIFQSRAIAGGDSVYQIAQQPVFPAKSKLLPDRRGDFMLLINGMPLIHVELKKSGIPVSQACHQIEKYAHEGVFTGLFSLVQVFVAMNPDETIYFANPGPDGKFNDDYYFHWADFNNEPVNDWCEIASKLLSIPMAHMLIGFYTVADSTDNTLKVMRSYQYYAASAIFNRVEKRKWSEPDQRGGYITHTTGSGKTLTSFKSAQLIAASGNADKVVFLMDRIELGTQSLREYRGFANESESVQATENTGVLITKLKSSNPADTLIVTSIQKMSRIDEDGGYKAKDIELINRKRIVFIIDECHRDVFGDMLRTIKDTFPNAMFFGFTGTPIEKENQKKMSTTTDVFGDELHRYTIADGIRDRNVLGFEPTMVMTYKDSDLRKRIALEKAKASAEAEVFTDPKKEKIYYKYMDASQVPMAGYLSDDGTWVKGIEDYIPSSQYERKEHRQAVVEDIRDHWVTLSRDGKFHAIFATGSIPEAIAYYDLFQKMAPHIKTAALFDQNIDNNGTAIFKEEAIVKMLAEYNKRYKQDFRMASYAYYKKDVALRLAHKQPYVGIENDREKQLDLLIVVDQMLTGFDSKWINTLYLDKKLQYEHLIQAFSRTNRLFGPQKPFGVVRYYRYPHTMAYNVEEAFRLYSGEKPLGIFADKLESNLIKMNEIFQDIADLFKTAGVADFDKLPQDKTEKAQFAKLFKNFNDCLEAAYIQGFSWDKSVYEFEHENEKITIEMSVNEIIYFVLAKRYKELFSERGEGDEDIPYEIDTHLTEINTGAIDHAYMNSRFKKYLKALQDGVETMDVLNELHKSFAILTQEEQKYAHIFLLDVQSGNVTVDEEKSLSDYISEYRAEASNDRIHRFAAAVGIDEDKLRQFMARHVTDSNINEFGLFDKLIDTADFNIAKQYFEKLEGAPVKPFRVRAKLDKVLRKFIISGGFDVE